jgi:hypothetical protein
MVVGMPNFLAAAAANDSLSECLASFALLPLEKKSCTYCNDISRQTGF